MILLTVFAFIAGFVTILSPCILPILPIILSSPVGDGRVGKSRPFGIVVGFILSFTFFTLFLSTIVRLSGIPADSLRLISIIVIAFFGASLLSPKFQVLTEVLFSKLARFVPRNNSKNGLIGGVMVGLSLGLLWTPCVGPILASVISLAITGTVTLHALIITLAYSLGTAIPMFLIIIGGQSVLTRLPFLSRNSSKIQRVFGVIMILTAIGIAFNVDRSFQTYILTKFPQYGVGLTKFEEVESVKQELDKLNKTKGTEESIGKPMFEVNKQKGVPAPEIASNGKWFNSEPLRLSELRGKVVLVDFWTYSCINCQRTFPYLKSWWEKYKEDGLVIIGVHSPEFEFEKNPANVEKALNDFGILYPVVMDNDFTTWRAYRNRYWPAKYLIDKDGNVRYTHFGEGEYDETETVIQALLKESGSLVNDKEIDNPSYSIYSRTPELYLGYGRIERLAPYQRINFEQINQDQVVTFTKPSGLQLGTFAFEGGWRITNEYATPSPGAKLHLKYEAKEVFLVMRSQNKNSTVKVTTDGTTQKYGEDNKDGVVVIDSDRLYKLINNESSGVHEITLEFEDTGIEVFAFTFG